MKNLIFTALILMSTQAVISQEGRILYRNNVQLNAGYTLYDGYGNFSINQKGINRFTSVISYDGFPTQRLSIGAFIGFTTSRYSEDSVYYYDGWSYTSTGPHKLKVKERRHFVGVKAATYLINEDKLQAYFGVGLALGRKREYVKYDEDFQSDYRQLVFMYDLHLGANYFFTEHFGVTGCLGYPLALVRAGITYRY